MKSQFATSSWGGKRKLPYAFTEQGIYMLATVLKGELAEQTLVTLLRNEVFRRGAIPYYGTSLSNLASWKTALSSGFTPAWIEVESRKITEKEFAK